MNRGNREEMWQRHCPVAIAPDGPCIKLSHGEGGRMMRRLLQEHILPILSNPDLEQLDDAARLPQIDSGIAISTDSYVVSPLFFPGGDIGKLAVYGTVNDLAVNGARPLYLSLALIIEEGFPVELLDLILKSISESANKLDVKIVAGDTKVVPAGAADGLFINTTGLGQLESMVPPGPTAIREGDELIVSGPIGQHGIAVLCAREELQLQPPPKSDCAPLLEATCKLRDDLGVQVRSMRDATRGGVAAVLHEWAGACELTMSILESELPQSDEVRGACELLGMDPLYVANEGTLVAAVAAGQGDRAVQALRQLPGHASAACIGKVVAKKSVPVTVQRLLGVEQPLDEPMGAPLPRIC